MIRPIRGKDVFMWVQRSGDYVLTVCCKSIGMDYDVEDIPTATKGSGTNNDYKAGYSDATLTMESLSTIDQLPRYQFWEFIENRRQKHQVKIVLTNTYGDILQYEFMAKIQRIGWAADVKARVPNSLSMKVCGDITSTVIYNALQDSDDEFILDSEGYLIRG